MGCSMVLESLMLSCGKAAVALMVRFTPIILAWVVSNSVLSHEDASTAIVAMAIVPTNALKLFIINSFPYKITKCFFYSKIQMLINIFLLYKYTIFL